MKKKPPKQKPQSSEFAIGQGDNVLCIKCGGVADENISGYGFCFKFWVVLAVQLQVA